MLLWIKRNMESLSLDEILVENGTTRKQLDKPCTKDDRDFIAVEEWSIKLLAHSIGLSPQQARDCEDDNHTPEERRRALLEKWHHGNGRKATYFKLVEGFAKIGRRDIVEKIINRVSTWVTLAYYLLFILLVVIPNGLFLQYFWKNNQNHLNTTQNIDNSTATIINSVVYDIGQYHKPIPWNAIPCEVKDAQNNLPTISNLFVGRDRDTTYISNTLQFNQGVQIININGPPAFGKSSLAIHVGHELVRRCIRVRYIDTTEHYLFQRKKIHNNVMEKYDSKDLLPSTTSTVQTFTYEQFTCAQSDRQDPNLQKWAETVDYPTLLILDNCDKVLHSELRDDFLQSAQEINKLSHGNVKTIITSQERLLLLENFQSWKVRELDLTTSVYLLITLVQDITPVDAEELAQEVGGCPLALKVIGAMLNQSGIVLLPTLLSQLQNNMLHIVDKVSDKRYRFSSIMDVVFSYLSIHKQQCAAYTSLFPGSFDSEASHAILSQLSKCSNAAEYLTQRSLLEEYYLHVQQRFRMHRLIREYFHEISTKKHLSTFNNAFNLHYSALILNYTMLHLTQGIDEVHEHRLNAESHNTLYLSQSIKERWQTMSQVNNSHDNRVFHKFSELVVHFSQPQHYNGKSIEIIFNWAISQGAVTFVCEVLKGQCLSYYSVVFDKIHEAVCGNSSVESCESLYTCSVTELTTPICLELKLNTSQFCTHISHFSQSCSSSVRVLYGPLSFIWYLIREIIVFCLIAAAITLCAACMVTFLDRFNLLEPILLKYTKKGFMLFQYCVILISLLLSSVLSDIILYLVGSIVKFNYTSLEKARQSLSFITPIPLVLFRYMMGDNISSLLKIYALISIFVMLIWYVMLLARNYQYYV